MKELENKTAIITGGARGIGQAIALTLAKEEIKCVISDLDSSMAEVTAKEIASLTNTETVAVGCNVADSKSVSEMLKKVLDKFGSIDILINNAGITADSLLVRMKEEDWQKVIDVNLTGAFNCLQAVGKLMMKQRSGKIVNISSIIGLRGNAGQTNYAASKAGLIGLTKSAARELASRGVNVNAVCPGFIKTEMTDRLPEAVKSDLLAQIPLGRFGEPEDVARVVLFLVSPWAAYITGQIIVVDGGMVM
ncbi:MAG: 3-oxoacyl-[acyl-carrier-protein] reductase [bacterium]|nr:3-oxoacyl-[acyl-carrier-protein] reductase [bacterium]